MSYNSIKAPSRDTAKPVIYNFAGVNTVQGYLSTYLSKNLKI